MDGRSAANVPMIIPLVWPCRAIEFKPFAMPTSPTRNPAIGWMGDLENIKLDDLQQWYKKWNFAQWPT